MSLLMSVKDVLSLLPKLTVVELQQVKIKVDFLLQTSLPIVNKEEDEYFIDWLTEGIVFELKRRGILSGKINRTLIYRVAPHSYKERCAAVRTTLLKKAATLNSQEHLVVGRLAARALSDYLTKFGNVSLKQMLQNIDNVTLAFNDAYPGYLESGMVGFLVRQGRKGEVRKRGKRE